MSGRMQENSDIAVRLVPEETRAGGMTTPVLWARRSSYMDGTHGVGAGNGVKGAITSFAKYLTVHIIHGSIPSETSPMWKPATGEPCAGKPPPRFGGRGGESLPYPYQTKPHNEAVGRGAPNVTRPLDCSHGDSSVKPWSSSFFSFHIGGFHEPRE